MRRRERRDFTSNTEHALLDKRRLYDGVRRINKTVQNKVHRSVTNNFGDDEVQGLQIDTYYRLNTAPQSLIGSKRVEVKGETSRLTLSMFFFGKRQPLDLICSM